MRHLIWNFESEPILFASNISRVALHQLNIENESKYRPKINVWRNHAIEPVLNLIHPYMKYAGFNAQFSVSDYDDSFSFSAYESADVEILWFDPTNYTRIDELAKWSWISERLSRLRQLTNKPILLISWYEGVGETDIGSVLKMPWDSYFINLSELCGIESASLLEKRAKQISGTLLSSKTHCKIAQSLGSRWLPAALGFNIRAVLVDLDNTLHEGIVVEDGLAGLKITAGHQKLHESLIALKNKGLFLCLVSRNELADVERVFEKKVDYRLKLSDFSVVEASWDTKSSAISRIVKKLNLGLESVLFIDDNSGELIEVAKSLEAVSLIHAKHDPEITRASLENFPGIWRFSYFAEDFKRISDWSANNERKRILDTGLSEREYMDELEVRIAFALDKIDDAERLGSLSQKTNQFNLSYSRFQVTDIKRIIKANDTTVISVNLSDRLSDSGIIGLIVANIDEKTCKIKELCLSCRAMGRGLEDLIIFGALKQMPGIAFCDSLEFLVERKERNSPAVAWLEKFIGKGVPMQQGIVTTCISKLELFNETER